MNRIEAMNVFARVAELGSFSAAASQLGIARSMVTRQVANLEKFLGAKLLVRTTRHVSLTSAGQAYLEKCREILSLLEEAESGVMEERHTPSGRLRISLPLSFGLSTLVPLLMDFRREYPDIRLALDFSDRTVNLAEEGIDLSIRITSYLDPILIVRKLGEARLLTVASPSYLLKHGAPEHPIDLSRHACLGYSPQVNNRPWAYSVDGKPERFYPTFVMQANNGDAMAQAALKGLGITLLPDFIVAPHILKEDLKVVLQAFEPSPLGIYAVLPSNRYVPLRVRVLLEYLSEQIGKITPALNASAG
ncbi:LysR family transcriptional regulator [Pseudomonas fluorescens]|uniref:LysR family transcriptional regulator n=1 Tax=Pseudomonas fluorescens TaxID=294 RepID=UPI002789D770|nr:LysR family transcriptional regulator [Pseudomonas fluorescens]MDP9780704.1 DNA-binding transcriptional LysR family regulator [Pseudomonas fluorescens]